MDFRGPFRALVLPPPRRPAGCASTIGTSDNVAPDEADGRSELAELVVCAGFMMKDDPPAGFVHVDGPAFWYLARRLCTVARHPSSITPATAPRMISNSDITELPSSVLPLPAPAASGVGPSGVMLAGNADVDAAVPADAGVVSTGVGCWVELNAGSIVTPVVDARGVDAVMLAAAVGGGWCAVVRRVGSSVGRPVGLAVQADAIVVGVVSAGVDGCVEVATWVGGADGGWVGGGVGAIVSATAMQTANRSSVL